MGYVMGSLNWTGVKRNNKINFICRRLSEMKKLILFVAFCLLMAGSVMAQDDPGARDSLIIQSVQVPLSADSFFVNMWALTDDSVMFYNIPLRLVTEGSGITFDTLTEVLFYPPIINWDDNFANWVADEQFLRMIGFADMGGEDNPPLQTNHNRVRCWVLKFRVADGATDQWVTIDSTTDSRSGGLMYGLIGGVDWLTPAFVPGVITFGQPVGIDDDGNFVPDAFALDQNYPNPFNPQTNIGFSLPASQNVSLEVYNLLGQHVKTLANGVFQAGKHTMVWDGTNDRYENVPSGIYFYSLNAEEFSQTNKMVLIR